VYLNAQHKALSLEVRQSDLRPSGPEKICEQDEPARGPPGGSSDPQHAFGLVFREWAAGVSNPAPRIKVGQVAFHEYDA